jgi:hypothetical protein
LNCWTSRTGAPVFTRSLNINIGKRSLNYKVLAIFAPLLILVGVAGFLIPANKSLTSGAPAYNIFHIAFGMLGVLVLWSGKEKLISFFNAGFGLIDLYQALASYLNLAPEEYFLWTTVDDALHVIIGLTLLIIGCYGLFRGRHS